MKSLNQIIAELETFANVHYQVHTFGHGDVWEIAPNSSSIVYPILWFVPQGATTGLREVTTNFTVLCMDLVRSGEENETEVLSDTLQIILDVVSYYRQQHDQNYIIEFGSNIQPFTERDPDMLAGHSITVSIRQPFNYSECAIPFSGAPTPIVPTCAAATIQNASTNPTYQASVSSGGVFTLPQLKVLDSDGITEILADYLPESEGYVAACSTICPDAAVENSDASYSTTVAGGDTLTLPDTPILVNGDLVVNQPSTIAKDVVVRYLTQGVAPTTVVSGDVVVPDQLSCPSLTIGVYSDIGLTNPITSADFQQVVYIQLHVVGITATEFRFMVFNASDNGVLYVEAGTPLTYTIASFNDLLIYGEATDGTDVASALTAFELTINADADANAYIAKHNALSGLTMDSAQQSVVQTTFQMLKGTGTTSGSNLWATLLSTNSEIYAFTPVSSAIISLPTIAIDWVNPATTATIVGFSAGDVANNGVTGGSGKYLILKRAPSDYGQNDCGTDAYARSLSGQILLGSTTTDINSQGHLIQDNPDFYKLNTTFLSRVALSVGLISTNRTVSTTATMYLNGVLEVNQAAASSTPSPNVFYAFANNSNGTPERYFTGKLAMIATRCSFNAAELMDWDDVWQYFTSNMNN